MKGSDKNEPRHAIERIFEKVLWNSRLVMLVAVAVSILLAFGAFYLALSDMVYLLGLLGDYAGTSLGSQAREELRDQIVTTIVKTLDGFLIGSILLLFAFGLYELFVSRIEVAERSETAPRLLRVRDLDDLKERVARLILLVLVIEFFQRALRIPYDNALDLLFLAVGILFVSGALYLIGRRTSPEEPGVINQASVTDLEREPKEDR